VKLRRGGYYYYCDQKKIEEYIKVPPEQKLQWLEEFNALTDRVLTRAQKKHREKIRKGLL